MAIGKETIAKNGENNNRTEGPMSPYVFTERFLGAFDWKEFACGCGAANINIGITYPFSKMIFRQMLHCVKARTAAKQLRVEGLKYLYRGMLPPLVQKTLALSLMFGVFGGTRRYLTEDFAMNEYMAKIIAGIVSGTTEAVLLPFERIQVLLAHSKFYGHFANSALAVRYVFVNYGFAEFYKGLVPVLCRNGPANAIFFMMREESLQHLPRMPSRSMQMAQEFATGALIGAVISSLFFPFNVVKVNMQSEMGIRSQSTWSTIKEIYHGRGSRIRYFYNGVAVNACRAFLSWGIMNAAYEMCRHLITPKSVKASPVLFDRNFKPKKLKNVFLDEQK